MDLNEHEKLRYSRHLMLPEFGTKGQLLLKQANVLVVGAGGLGSPVLSYLAAAGIGTIGIVDFDVVSLSNLQRQVLFQTNDLGALKCDVAAKHLQAINDHISVPTFPERLTVQNVEHIIRNFNLIIDCTDNFETRYLINDACVLLEKPFIHGSVNRYSGQFALFNNLLENGKRGATYRCIFPYPPESGSVQSCHEQGVLNTIPGFIGMMQAHVALKWIGKIGNFENTKLHFFDGNSFQWNQFVVERNEENWLGFPSDSAALRTFSYDRFCSSPSVEINSGNLKAWMKHEEILQIIDVRQPGEHPVINSNRVKLIPLEMLEAKASELRPEIPTLLVCASGYRSKIGADILFKKFGFAEVKSLVGGAQVLNEYLKGEMP
jgi:molybdopterin/thiamine biosynthesis adenylyltransferase/rhodanese-related sulfurtransferase